MEACLAEAVAEARGVVLEGGAETVAAEEKEMSGGSRTSSHSPMRHSHCSSACPRMLSRRSPGMAQMHSSGSTQCREVGAAEAEAAAAAAAILPATAVAAQTTYELGTTTCRENTARLS